MIPQIELYLNTERDWVSEAMLERFAEALELFQTLRTQHTAHAFAFVVQRGIGVQQVNPPAAGAPLRVANAEHYAVRPAVHHSAGTHGARFFGDVYSAALQAPISHSGLSGGQRQHLGMGSSILKGFHLVPPTGNHAIILHNHAAAGHLAGRASLLSLAHSQHHEMFVLRQGENE